MEILGNIDLSQSKLVPEIINDYFKKDQFLADKVNTWHEFSGWEQLIKERNFPPQNRSILVQNLLQSYQEASVKLDTSSKVYGNIQLLLQENTFTITTGHQLSLFGGTLFMAYKILTAIKITQELNIIFSDKNFVPVFWLASEDHDFEEIKSTYLFGKTIVWDKDSMNQPTGRIETLGLDLVVNQIIEVLGDTPIAQKWIEMIQKSYLEQSSLDKASLHFYHDLYAELGLVIINPDRKAYKELLVPIIENDLLKGVSYSAQQESDEYLEARYKLQIHARPCNFFYLDKTHGRKLIKQSNTTWEFEGIEKSWTQETLLEEIRNWPEQFSPNVNVRPVFQELILPNLAYIGGPAECAYWLQLKPVFDVHQQNFPKVVLRFMQVVFGKGLKEKVEKLGLDPMDLLLPEKEMVEKLIELSHPFAFHEKFEETLEMMQEIVDQSRLIDPALGKEFLDAKLKLKDLFKSKSGVIKKGIEQSEQASIDKLLKLRSRIYPSGIFQERIETLLQLEISAGRTLSVEILELLNPINGELLLTEV
jgi:bacillithiol biosynthesis cysteine-adding enzyme BshC